MTIKTVVADDELLARERVKRLISADPDFEIVQECSDGAELLHTLLSRDIDLLILDVQMPGLSGLEVLNEMGERKLPMIVFVTAHDCYAIQAFGVRAVDYLVKPIEAKRFQDAIQRVREHKQVKADLSTQATFKSLVTALGSAAVDSGYPVRFLVHCGTKDLFVNVSDVGWIEASDYYVILHVAENTHLLRESIKRLEGQLDPRKFVRIHRSAIVNIDRVREIHREGRSEGWVLMASGDRVNMSTAGWQRLLAASQAR